MKLIENEFGRMIYKELVKTCIILFREIPLSVPKDILKEIEADLVGENFYAHKFNT